MQISTQKFGQFAAEAATPVSFAAGIPGFPNLRDALLVPASATELFADVDQVEGVFVLQSIDDADLAFLCIDPFLMFADYEVVVESDDDAESFAVAILTVTDGDGPIASRATANLRAPIVVDAADGSARQVILDDERWQVRHPLGV